jgi:FkbM family methyltransferase
MVDVGAHFGGSLLPFARSGWEVWAVEPDPANRSHLTAATQGLVNVHVDPRAVTEHTGERLPLFTSTTSTGISTLVPFHGTHVPAVEVETVRLDDLLDEAGVDEVAFLKTDLEGYDLPALRSFPWDRLRPDVVVCEFEDRKTRALGYDFHALASLLTGHGYEVLVSEWDPIIEYGTRHRWRRVFTYPGELADTEAWGNLIAVAPSRAGRARRIARAAGWRLRSRLVVESLVRRRPVGTAGG